MEACSEQVPDSANDMAFKGCLETVQILLGNMIISKHPQTSPSILKAKNCLLNINPTHRHYEANLLNCLIDPSIFN